MLISSNPLSAEQYCAHSNELRDLARLRGHNAVGQRVRRMRYRGLIRSRLLSLHRLFTRFGPAQVLGSL